MKIYVLIGLIFYSISFHSCGGAGARIGGKALQKIVQNFAKNAGKNSSKAIRFRGGSVPTRVTKNGRLIPYGQLAKYSKIKIPNPKSLSVIRNGGNLEGTKIACSTIKSSKVDLLLYDAAGNPIIYANETQHYLVYTAAQRVYQKRAVGLVDDILVSVKNNKITTDTQLKKVINSTVAKHLGKSTSKNPVVMDVATGNLAFNVEFQSGSQIVGSINIYDTVKKGVVIGAGGYYLARKI